MGVKLKKCDRCGWNPIIERWASGGTKYMVKCNNPNCDIPSESYPSGHDLGKVMDEWNRRNNHDRKHKGY